MKNDEKRAKFVRKCPVVRQFKNFARNTKLAFFHLNLLIAYLVAQEKNGKFFRKKKNFGKILSESAASSDRSRISTILQFRRFCFETCNFDHTCR